MFTADEIDALAKKARASGSAGVFSLDQLKALGQTGNLKTDWMKGGAPDKNALISGGGRAMVPTDIPAGYYQVPGLDGAYYYDPKSGQAPKEFVDWANNLKASDRDPFTGAPKALIPNSDAGDVFRSQAGQQPAAINTLNDIFKLGRGPDGTYQDAQDRTLGIGAYQQFVTGKDGKQVRIQDVPGYVAPPAQFTDVSPDKTGAFDRLLKETGMTAGDLAKTIGDKTGGGAIPDGGLFSNNQFGSIKKSAGFWLDLRNALAANYEKNALAYQGLQKERAARGLDPATGISTDETKKIYDTYNRISDPAQRDAYLRYQDPGNLTPDERLAQQKLRAPELKAIDAQNAKFQRVEQSSFYNGEYLPGVIRTTFGSKMFTDKATGRSTYVSGIPIRAQFDQYKQGKAGTFASRFGGAMMGTALGFLTGGPLGAILGAYSGAGGWMPNARDIGGKKGLKGFGEWSAAPAGHLPTPTEIGSSIMFASMFGTGEFGKGTGATLIGKV